MTYPEFERVFGRARVLKGLPPYTVSDVRVFYDELKGFEDADIIKAFEESKKSKNYFALVDLKDTIYAEMDRRREPAKKVMIVGEEGPTLEEIRAFRENLGKIVEDKKLEG